MKNQIAYLFILFGTICNAQLTIDSTQYSIHLDVAVEKAPYFLYTCSYDNIASKSYLLRYDQHLNFIDTLPNSETGRQNAKFLYPFNFNGKLYSFCADNTPAATRHFSIHEIKNGQLFDSIPLNLDTISNGYPHIATQIDSNTLRLIVQPYPPAQGTSSRILDLDSNFNLKTHHKPNLSLISPFSNLITAVYALNDSVWHIYTPNGITYYNPQTKSSLTSTTIVGRVFSFLRLSGKEYLAFGTSSVLEEPSSPGTAVPSLGFYRVTQDMDIIDTTSFNAFSHSLGPTYTAYSSESIQSNNTNTVAYDSSNIYMVAQGQYSPPNSSSTYRFFHIAKCDHKGNLHWRWIWGSSFGSLNCYGISPTPDLGVAVVGEIRNHGVLIKLGPDGTISNVELDAPETVVNFYPNPVKDKLYYSLLPEAKGPYTLEIIDMQGKPVFETTLDAQSSYVPMQLQAGFYLYNLKNDAAKVEQVGKLMVE